MLTTLDPEMGDDPFPFLITGVRFERVWPGYPGTCCYSYNRSQITKPEAQVFYKILPCPPGISGGPLFCFSSFYALVRIRNEDILCNLRRRHLKSLQFCRCHDFSRWQMAAQCGVVAIFKVLYLAVRGTIRNLLLLFDCPHPPVSDCHCA